jgi:SagB-type dehydrogenase family enzyme
MDGPRCFLCEIKGHFLGTAAEDSVKDRETYSVLTESDIILTSAAYGYPDPNYPEKRSTHNPPGEWVTVPGQWVEGKWVPAHRMWIPVNPWPPLDAGGMGRMREKSNASTRQPGIGERFQKETKYDPEKMGTHSLDWDHRPEALKNYVHPIAAIPLPDPEIIGDANIWKALRSRRSRRVYLSERPLPLRLLSTLLWATQGATARYGETLFRTAPSAGGLYPVETYLSTRSVDGIEPGIYHFRPMPFDLEYIRRGDQSRLVAEAALGQTLILGAQVTFIWSAVLARGKWKYRERAYRYIYLDAGHIAQNLYLAAEALGLGACAVGAFYDDQMNGIVGLDGTEETVIYMASAGWPTPDP